MQLVVAAKELRGVVRSPGLRVGNGVGTVPQYKGEVRSHCPRGGKGLSLPEAGVPALNMAEGRDSEPARGEEGTRNTDVGSPRWGAPLLPVVQKAPGRGADCTRGKSWQASRTQTGAFLTLRKS